MLFSKIVTVCFLLNFSMRNDIIRIHELELVLFYMSYKYIRRNLGENCDYQTIWRQMHDFTRKRDQTSVDEVWLLQHNPVFTLGKAGLCEHIIETKNIPVVRTDRGGQVTYHGPGQLMFYPLINLRRLNINVKKFVEILQNIVIATLRNYGVAACAREDAPGVYVDGAKIASIGLRVNKGCSYHGLAFNIDMDLSPFSQINPCGFRDLKMTQLSDFISSLDFSVIENKLCGCFSDEMTSL